MLHNDLFRSILLVVIAGVFVLVTLRSVFQTGKVAEELGYTLNGKNGYSEFYAIYVGVWLATAMMAVFAAFNIKQALLGDLVAMLVVAQPVGRIIAAARYGLPNGPLLFMFLLELVGGLLLLAIRPQV